MPDARAHATTISGGRRGVPARLLWRHACRYARQALFLSHRTEADFQAWRDQRNWTARKYALWDAGKRLEPRLPAARPRRLGPRRPLRERPRSCLNFCATNRHIFWSHPEPWQKPWPGAPAHVNVVYRSTSIIGPCLRDLLTPCGSQRRAPQIKAPPAGVRLEFPEYTSIRASQIECGWPGSRGSSDRTRSPSISRMVETKQPRRICTCATGALNSTKRSSICRLWRHGC